LRITIACRALAGESGPANGRQSGAPRALLARRHDYRRKYFGSKHLFRYDGHHKVNGIAVCRMTGFRFCINASCVTLALPVMISLILAGSDLTLFVAGLRIDDIETVATFLCSTPA
jgi:hypothetical protein